jgi:uncharacterized protein YjdB
MPSHEHFLRHAALLEKVHVHEAERHYHHRPAGKVTAVAVGKAVITAKSGELTGTQEVEVVAATPAP